MAIDHDVTLTLYQSATAHLDVSVFDEYRITLDMFRAGNPWTFTCWASSVGENAFTELKRSVKLGARAVFSIDGAPQMAGPVETVRIDIDRQNGVRMILSGRDAAATAIDWDADPKVNVRGRAVGDVVVDLLNRVGIEVQPTSGASAREALGRPRSHRRRPAVHPRRQRVDIAHARPDEKAWTLVQEVCKKVGLMAWIAPDPQSITGMWIVLDVPDYDQTPTFAFRRIVRDGVVLADSNVLESSFEVSIKDVPTRVEAYGRAARGDEAAARLRHVYTNTVLAQFPEVVSPLPPHPRFLHAHSRSVAQAKQAAARCMAEGMAHFREYTCTVQGHGQTVDGEPRLYTINTMANVGDTLSNIHGPRTMLITRVEFSGSRRAGQTTKLTLGAKGAVQIFPETA